MPRSSRVAAPRTRLSFNSDWLFHRGDAPDAGDRLDYERIRPWLLATGTELLAEGLPRPVRPEGNPGAGISFTRPDHDDSTWRSLGLPHDWGIEGPFGQELPGETGKLPWPGVGWYRKHFRLSPADRGRRISLCVDGAMAFSAFWLNGQFVGGWPYGYTSFRLDLDPFISFAQENVLAVRLDNPPNSSRWYPGSGLYRNVWLVKTGPVRVARFGTYITTPRVSRSSALVSVDTTLENTSEQPAEITLETRIWELDADGKRSGKPVGQAEVVRLKLDPGRQALRTQCLEVKRPKLWGLGRTNRYLAVTELLASGRVLDQVETPFGIRTLSFDPDRGFFLNGEHVPLRGVCLHHDLGALGAALHTRALERQLDRLLEMGANAIRTSHNPPAPELLELCDRKGMLVMVEAFDCWQRGKKHLPDVPEAEREYFDYARVFLDWHERDLRTMVRRDRNHPSVVLWSIGNEVIEQWYSDGWKLATHLGGIVREEDRTRPITSGFNGEISAYSGFQTAVDVIGFNYKPNGEYQKLHQRHPTLPILASETSSCVSSRGEYFFPVSDDKSQGQVDFQVSSYDLSAAPWASPPDREFRALDEAPFVAGEFVWTGFDYLGEPTPYNSDATNLLNFSDADERARMAVELEKLGRIAVPSRSSYFGILDLAGFPKDRYYLYQARWRPELRLAHILPHWNWPERVGEITPVHVYSAGDQAELFLNGRSQGVRRRKRGEYRFRWDRVAYRPGELEVVVYRRGKRWAKAVRRTTGPASRVVVAADRQRLLADGQDLAFVTCAVADERRQVVPRARALVRFTVEGPADLVAVDNGDPTSFESFQAPERSTFNGLALVVLRTRRREPGVIRLRAESAGLSAAELVLKSVTGR
jgi:beta-galactosidase